MAYDFSMCRDSQCAARHLCQRHAESGTAVHPYQRYHDFQRPADLTRCRSYWPTQEARDLDELREVPSYG